MNVYYAKDKDGGGGSKDDSLRNGEHGEAGVGTSRHDEGPMGRLIGSKK